MNRRRRPRKNCGLILRRTGVGRIGRAARSPKYFLLIADERGMRQLPTLLEDVGINRERRERIVVRESIGGAQRPVHSERASLLHPGQLGEDVLFAGEFVARDLGLKSPNKRRKETNFGPLGAECPYGKCVKAELQSGTVEQFFLKAGLRPLASFFAAASAFFAPVL